MIDEIFIKELNSLGVVVEYNSKQYKLCNGSIKTVEEYRVSSCGDLVEDIAALTITDVEKNAEILNGMTYLAIPQAVKILHAIERKMEE